MNAASVKTGIRKISRIMADQEAGSPVTEGLLPLDPETVKQAVDCSPGEELPLWQP